MTIRPDEEELTIRTGGKTLGGWTEFRVFRGVEIMPSGFAVGLTERYPTELRQAVVEPFSPCEVFLTGDKILTGYIDRYTPFMQADDHEAAIQGRSKTEDLVDCSVDVEKTGWQISGGTLGQCAKQVCDPYGIEVVLPDGDVQMPSPAVFSVIPGMTCWQLLEELARAAQMLIWDDAEGRLVLSKAGTTRAGSAIVEGQNAEIAGAAFSADQRYSDYWVVASGQIEGAPGHVNYFTKVQDSRTPRRRVLMIVMDLFDPDEKWPRQRAEWERSRRYGRSRQIQVTVTGWRDVTGQLWTPNTMTHVSCPTLKIDEDWLIVSCDWRRSERGTQTIMQLMPPDGVRPAPFFPLPPIPIGAGTEQAPTTDQIVAGGGT